MSSDPLGSAGITGRSAIICRHVLKNWMPGMPVSSSILRTSCSRFLHDTRAPLVLSLGRHLVPCEIISSAIDGPDWPR